MPPAAAFKQFWVEAGRAGAVMVGVETVELSIRSQEAGGSDGSASSARDAQGGSSPARSEAEGEAAAAEEEEAAEAAAGGGGAPTSAELLSLGVCRLFPISLSS